MLYVTYAVGNFEGKARDVDKEPLARLPCTIWRCSRIYLTQS